VIKTQSPATTATNSETGTPDKTTPGNRYAWYVVLVMTAMYMLSFVDRQILTLLVPMIKRDLHASDTQIGLLQGLAFALFYTLMGLPLGRMVDSCKRRTLIGICVFIWSLFTAFCAATRSYSSLFLSRIGVGIGEAGLSPAAYSIISDYFPSSRMSTAISVYYLGLYFGSSLALLVGGITVDALARTPTFTLPILGEIASWRITFLIVGMPGLLLALLAFTIREPLRRNRLLDADGNPVKTSFREAFAQMRLRWQSVVGIALGMVFQCMANYAVMTWFPIYFLRVHHWTTAQTGKALAVILLVFGCSGMYVGGILSDHWQKKGIADGPLRIALISAAAILVFLTPASLFSDARMTLAFLAVGMFFLSLPMGTTVAALQMIFPNQVRGQVTATFLFVINLGGLNLGPLLPGLFNDRLFHSEMMIGPSLALTIGGASILMLLIFLSALRPYRTHYSLSAHR
jgi:MFS family permease